MWPAGRHHDGDRLAAALGAGLLCRVMRKKLGLKLTSEMAKGVRTYRIAGPVPDRRGLKPGAILVREHAGVLHRVVVAAPGRHNGEWLRLGGKEFSESLGGSPGHHRHKLEWAEIFRLRSKSREARRSSDLAEENTA